MTGTFRGMFHNRKSPSPMTCRMVARAPGLFDASNPSHIRQEASSVSHNTLGDGPLLDA